VVEVDHHPRPAAVSVGVKLCAGDDFADLDIDRTNPVVGLFGLFGGQAHGGGLGIGEEYLRHRVVVGGGRVRAPRRGVHRHTVGAGTDRRAGDAGLVFALVGQQRAVVGVAHRIQPVPVDTADSAGVVDVKPCAGA